MLASSPPDSVLIRESSALAKECRYHHEAEQAMGPDPTISLIVLCQSYDALLPNRMKAALSLQT